MTGVSVRRRSRQLDELIFRGATGFFAVALIGIVIATGVTLVVESRLSIAQFGWSFWHGVDWNPVAGEFGARPFIWGTMYSSVLALAISTPISLGIAIYTSELAPLSIRRPLVFVTELLAAIPSIVYGLWGLFVLVPFVRRIESATPDWLQAVLIRHAERTLKIYRQNLESD